jgi:hypothetical protein
MAEWQGPGVGRGGEIPAGNQNAVARGGQVVVPGGGGQGLRGGPPPRGQQSILRGGSLKVVTTQFREGYLRKNGVPYSERAVFTEFWDMHTLPNGAKYLVNTNVVEDPVYLQVPFQSAIHYTFERDTAKWAPTPCDARF